MPIRKESIAPGRAWVIREHCQGHESALLANTLTMPMIVIIKCRGCGREITERGYGNHAADVIDAAVKKWNGICGRKEA